MRIVIAKEGFNGKTSLMTSKLNIELRKILIMCYVWGIAFYGSEIWTLSKLERQYSQTLEMWCRRRKGRIKWSEKVTNEQALERIGKKTLLNK